MNNIKRIQELAGIKTESFKFDNVIDFFIERDNPQVYYYKDGDWNNILNHETKYIRNGRLKIGLDKPFYDLGGAEDPIDSPNNIVVDIFDNSEEFNNVNKYIVADLDNYIKLSPLSHINVSFSAAYINPTSLSKTIDHALESGGILGIVDHCSVVADVMNNLKNYKLIEITVMGYQSDNPGNTIVWCVFQK
jgi:hypothetical protein